MANQRNYVTDIPNTTLEYTKFTVSRIVDNPLSSIIELELPATIPDTFDVEVSLYSLYDNVLVYNTTLSTEAGSELSGIFTLKTLSYVDTSSRKLLFFDLSKTDIQQIYGRFQILFSFLSPKVGSYKTTPLMITKISPSRTELELQLKPEYKTATSARYLKEYVSPQISAPYTSGILRQIFNQPTQPIDVNIPTDSTNISYDIIKSYFSPQTLGVVNNATLGVEATVIAKIQQVLNTAYTNANSIVSEQINAGATFFTNDELTSIVSSSLSYAIGTTNTIGVRLA
jgi:hypothetical protein